jgi:hypothetical protein
VPTHEIVEPVTVRALRELVLPTAPDKITGAVLPALRVRDRLPDVVPLTVPAKEIPEDPVVLIARVELRNTGVVSFTVNEAALMTLPPRVRAVPVGRTPADTVIAPRGC